MTLQHNTTLHLSRKVQTRLLLRTVGRQNREAELVNPLTVAKAERLVVLLLRQQTFCQLYRLASATYPYLQIADDTSGWSLDLWSISAAYMFYGTSLNVPEDAP